MHFVNSMGGSVVEFNPLSLQLTVSILISNGLNVVVFQLVEIVVQL